MVDKKISELDPATDLDGAEFPVALGAANFKGSVSKDGTLSSNSDAEVPTVKAVKSYADALIAAADAMVFKGVIDCSTNPNYPAADRGWTYRVSVAGKIGGASGINVEAGDILICLTDGTASGNQATVGAAWSVIQANLDGALTSASIGVTVQAFSSILAAIAGLTGAANDDVIQRKAGAFTNRTMAQLAVDLGSLLGVFTGVQMFTASGTYTPTSGTKRILAIAQAPGGGGGGVGTTNGNGKAGSGSAGETRVGVFAAPSPNASVTIGSVGAGASAGNNAGTDGGDIVLGSLMTAKGGKAGGGSTGANGVNGTNGGVPTGGSGGVVIPASDTPVHGVGNFAVGSQGMHGGSSPFGLGGRGYYQTTGQADGEAAGGPGGGGLGGMHQSSGTAVTGGNGGSGWLLIIEVGTP